MTLLSLAGTRENDMTKTKHPPVNLSDWARFLWLWLTNPTFQASRDKRKAYFEHRLATQYNSPFR
jgi:hypothetical protein